MYLLSESHHFWEVLKVEVVIPESVETWEPWLHHHQCMVEVVWVAAVWVEVVGVGVRVEVVSCLVGTCDASLADCYSVWDLNKYAPPSALQR